MLITLQVAFCEDAATYLQSCLSDLQQQNDNARDLINETFQSYKAVLEKQRDHVLEELEKMHHTQELAVMDMFHNVDKTIQKIEQGCK